jgi:hypothetical protein
VKPTLLEFERTTDDLAQLLARSTVEDELLKADTTDISPERLGELLGLFRKSVEPFVIRQAQYAMQLILLYGAFERLIEGLLVGTLTTLNELVPTYSDLPERIRDNHRRKSIDALRDDVWLARSNDPLLPTKLIECLHSCEARSSNYKLNSVAYGKHSANYRRVLIDNAFHEIGVDHFLALIATAVDFKRYLAAASRERGLLDEEFGAIDDLAERRNEIAHGSPAQLLTRDQMTEYVLFFNVFASSAYSVLRRHLARFLVAHHAISLGRVERVHYKNVFCLDLGILPEGTWVETEDSIALDLGSDIGYEIGKIVNIRIEAGDVKKCRSETGLAACFETSFRLTANRKIFLIRRDCPATWMLD